MKTRTPEQRQRRWEKAQRKKACKRAEREAKWAAAAAHLPPPTDHARQRWAERFRPDESFAEAYARSRAVSGGDLRARVKGAGLVFRLNPDGEFRRDDQTGAVFVIGGRERVVLTVVRICLPPPAA